MTVVVWLKAGRVRHAYWRGSWERALCGTAAHASPRGDAGLPRCRGCERVLDARWRRRST